ncbi:hypothetical protein COW36_18965 [bacterium (Candidatus Blackallbacteria) CG17_big_fil_post_rev_8_21_14_2_50_48_46]|uniref:Uncharacterized protein n=1 Tax=bacterium (Candidatus Blackallbacteria) CG17_big_fil_post_rev_8_21_14_2_50_48_46 TaxID=2014261 RepID=A0A2M7G018_9BACT|nr:MAG: hypothetical protein COW64_25505 [bacterium (Candidatus Blackallbacteria) CG18_big_fil_WC_8_21_14_2_50_49_26]PIW15009.1 MAG: hypothetical protein COW36_18965 [bacterium (Candidatus Blackallbacteria) CG17_big_fil_post_rev_8_21_14_2_50_48_46]PIW50090.1 MAG: hypothetical protein COW20_03900 [bacterium (Candidatus Blackallbacteria) CG13_big_fil_rev_8_21_14_2_50_49_14]
MLPDLYTMVMTPVLRAFLSWLGSSTGVWIRFEKIKGEFFNYRVCLEEVDLKISNILHIAAQKCTLEFSILDFSFNQVVVSNLLLEGARIEYTHVSNQDLLPRSLPPFLIHQLTLKQSEVIFKESDPNKPLAFKLALDDYHCDSLHSKWLLFNAIFNSRLAGQLDGTPITLKYSEAGDKRISHWALRGLPIKKLTPFVDGKLDLLQDSSMDLLVTNEWLPDQDEIGMNVQVWVHDLVNFKQPKFLPAPTKALADAMGILINRQVKTIPLAFQFSVRKDDFMEISRIDASGMVIAFAEALSKAILDKSLQNFDQILDMGFLGLDTLLDIKNIFDKY